MSWIPWMLATSAPSAATRLCVEAGTFCAAAIAAALSAVAVMFFGDGALTVIGSGRFVTSSRNSTTQEMPLRTFALHFRVQP